LGWNTWCTLSDCHNGDNNYFDRCNEWEVKEIGQAMIDSGMHAVGFEYVNLDDCWGNTERDSNGNIQPDPARFPSGMKAIADWLHAKGLQFGLYTSMGGSTCNPGGRPKKIPGVPAAVRLAPPAKGAFVSGSFGKYKEDAATFAR
jgi:alpha-galactosidase